MSDMWGRAPNGCPTSQKVITNVTRVFDGATVWEP